MKISLLTDAPKHNLALMKISAYHKAQGDEVQKNMPLWKGDKTYASILFEWNKNKFIADVYGGSAFWQPMGMGCPNEPRFLSGIGSQIPVETIMPDYTLFNCDYSLGYTFRFCPRSCAFCKVTPMEFNNREHHSIWSFHLPDHKKICLLNNNTFFDSRWKETFEEIWEANLSIVDENGYDLRLVDEEKAEALKKTKWTIPHTPHFSWDKMEDEIAILQGLNEINRVGLRWCEIYILIGFDTTIEEDIYRCQKIHDMGHDPYVMVYKNNHLLNDFRTMIYSRCYKRTGNIEKTWKEYSRRKR